MTHDPLSSNSETDNSSVDEARSRFLASIGLGGDASRANQPKEPSKPQDSADTEKPAEEEEEVALSSQFEEFELPGVAQTAAREVDQPESAITELKLAEELVAEDTISESLDEVVVEPISEPEALVTERPAEAKFVEEPLGDLPGEFAVESEAGFEPLETIAEADALEALPESGETEAEEAAISESEIEEPIPEPIIDEAVAESVTEAEEPVAEAPVKEAPEPVAPAAEVKDSVVTLACPTCGYELVLNREHIGVPGECVDCGTPIVAAESPADGVVRIFALGAPKVPIQEEAIEDSAEEEVQIADELLEEEVAPEPVEEAAAEVVETEVEEPLVDPLSETPFDSAFSQPSSLDDVAPEPIAGQFSEWGNASENAAPVDESTVTEAAAGEASLDSPLSDFGSFDESASASSFSDDPAQSQPEPLAPQEDPSQKKEFDPLAGTTMSEIQPLEWGEMDADAFPSLEKEKPELSAEEAAPSAEAKFVDAPESEPEASTESGEPEEPSLPEGFGDFLSSAATKQEDDSTAETPTSEFPVFGAGLSTPASEAIPESKQEVESEAQPAPSPVEESPPLMESFSGFETLVSETAFDSNDMPGFETPSVDEKSPISNPVEEPSAAAVGWGELLDAPSGSLATPADEPASIEPAPEEPPVPEVKEPESTLAAESDWQPATDFGLPELPSFEEFGSQAKNPEPEPSPSEGEEKTDGPSFGGDSFEGLTGSASPFGTEEEKGDTFGSSQNDTSSDFNISSDSSGSMWGKVAEPAPEGGAPLLGQASPPSLPVPEQETPPGPTPEGLSSSGPATAPAQEEAPSNPIFTPTFPTSGGVPGSSGGGATHVAQPESKKERPVRKPMKRAHKRMLVFFVVVFGFVCGAALASFVLPVDEYVAKAKAFLEEKLDLDALNDMLPEQGAGEVAAEP